VVALQNIATQSFAEVLTDDAAGRCGWTLSANRPKMRFSPMSLFGILNVNKPSGRTSRDVVNHIEQLTRPVKAGHAGTLDPLATGVLVICVGRATRLIQYVQRMPKRYRATFLLGRRSETDDIEGNVVEIPGAPQPSHTELDRLLPQFLGEISQRPPAHSAVKVRGRRAFELARAGKEVDLAPRSVTIHGLVVKRYAYPELEVEIECGSGTYVRALGRDLAVALGTGAVMSVLVRLGVGQFRVEDAVTMDGLNAGILASHMQPALRAVADLPQVVLHEGQLVEIRHGRPIARPAPGDTKGVMTSGEWAAVNSALQLVAILREKRAGELWPVMNLS
jgi:tRNA pseudouridine55 synthase